MDKEKIANIRRISSQINEMDGDIDYLKDLIREDKNDYKFEVWHDRWLDFTKEDFQAMIEVRCKKIDEAMEELKHILNEEEL